MKTTYSDGGFPFIILILSLLSLLLFLEIGNAHIQRVLCKFAAE